MEQNFKQKLNSIRCFAFDMDGVLTNGQLHITDDGKLLRSMSIKDGFAMQHALKKGYEIIVISGSSSDGSSVRLHKLGVDNVFFRAENKFEILASFLLRKNIKWDEVLCMGDDVPDREILKSSGIATCPADAMDEIKEVCIYVSQKKGGLGCVRDVIEQVMRLQNKWN